MSTFPSGYKDLPFQTRLIEAKWKRFYPPVPYTPIVVRTAPQDYANLNLPANEAGATGFDPLWAESVDSALTVWRQPHATGGTVRANDVEVYGAPVMINVRVYAEDVDGDLKDWGIEAKLDLTVVAPASLFDAAGVTPRPGDKFTWQDGVVYDVRQVSRNKRYLNTARVLYAVLNCSTKRLGS